MPERARKCCVYCRGDGEIGCIPSPACEGKGFFVVYQPVTRCSRCHVTGITGCSKCITCKGAGYANVIKDNSNER